MATDNRISKMQAEYAHWVKETCACGACGIDVPHLSKYLVNRNIRPILPSQPNDSMPQAGYLGEDYLRFRVLVLGKNPAWPKNIADDKAYYELLQNIQDIPTLQENMPALRKMHNDWTPLKASELDLVRQVGLKPTEIAYSNQILCRTDNHKIDQEKPDAQRGAISRIDRKTIKPIYESCFRNRICELIEILEPKHILSIGRLDDIVYSWPHVLERLLRTRPQSSDIRVWHVRFPTGQGGYVKEAREDISGLREALGIMA